MIPSFSEYCNKLLLESNPDKRVAFLFQKYYDKLYKLFDTYWDYFKTEALTYGLLGADAIGELDDDKPKDWDDFIERSISKVISDVDPDKGKYSDWILKGLVSVSRFDQKNKWLGRFWEDSYKISDDINAWKKYRKYLAKYDKNAIDINHFPDYQMLHITISLAPEVSTAKRAENEKLRLAEAEKDAKKIYNSSDYMIVIPGTKEASCAYGRGTRWCTASNGNGNVFYQYSQKGPLYIVINKKSQEKYQFHFQTEQYMDAQDDPLSLPIFFKENPELKGVLIELANKNDNQSFEQYIEDSD